MLNEIEKERELLAKNILKTENRTCVFVTDVVWSTDERGIKPLLKVLGEGREVNGAVVADKVVGKAAAFLYALMKVRSVYAYTVSEPALEVLAGAGIEVCAEKVVPAIRNRTDTGQCPMETLVWDTSDAYQAYEKLKKATESGGLKVKVKSGK